MAILSSITRIVCNKRNFSLSIHQPTASGNDFPNPNFPFFLLPSIAYIR
jgi:hypothetical protein